MALLVLAAVVVAMVTFALLRASPGHSPHSHAAACASGSPAIRPGTPPAPSIPQSPPRASLEPALTASTSAEKHVPALPPTSGSPLAVEKQSTPPAGPPADDEIANEMRRQVDRFKDASIPVAQRLKEIETLARTGDEPSVAVLKALGNEHTYLNYAAVEALGKVKAPGVPEYLTGKLAHPDSRMICAAVKSLAAIKDEKAVAPIAGVLKANRTRPDGHHDDVCGACVDSLGAIHAVSAIPVLKTEMEQTVGVTLQHEYGSRVVQALKQIGDPVARPVLMAYADRLSKEEQALADNPMGQHYLQQKIKEARDAAATLMPQDKDNP